MTAGIIALSRQQVGALLEDELDGTGPCQLVDSLGWAELRATSVVPGARLLMAEMAAGGIRLTAKGKLNRKSVEMLVDNSRWHGRDSDELRAICKVVNEQDFAPAMYLRAMFKLAGLARRERGVLKLTRKGQALLAENAAGQLQATLFHTTFARYNLGYLDGFGPPDIFAPQIGLILFLIGQFCSDWRPADALMRSVTMPMEDVEGDAWRPTMAFSLRVLRYLCWFGLLEESLAPKETWSSPGLFRKTPLYDRMLSFAIE